MAICIKCDEEFNDRRRALGYETCLDCGEVIARSVVYSTAPLHNKGAYQLVTSGTDIKDLGR